MAWLQTAARRLMRRSVASLSIWPEYGGSLGHVRARVSHELLVGEVAELALPDTLAAELLALHEAATGEGSAHADPALVEHLERFSEAEFVRWAYSLADRIGAAMGPRWVVCIDDHWADDAQ